MTLASASERPVCLLGAPEARAERTRRHRRARSKGEKTIGEDGVAGGKTDEAANERLSARVTSDESGLMKTWNMRVERTCRLGRLRAGLGASTIAARWALCVKNPRR